MKKQELILKQNLHKILQQSLLLILFLCMFTSFTNSQIIPITSNGPLKLGQSVVTSYSATGGNYNVVRVIDIRNRPPFMVGGSELYPNQFAGQDWTHNRMGNVFGIAIDDNANPNIFVARSTVYCFENNSPPEPNPAIIYRLDGNNWGVSTYIHMQTISGPPQANVNWIPNMGSGIGNICYDKWHQQIFATNHEDGKIYRIKDNGGVGQVESWYDPFSIDDGEPGFAPNGEKLWGIGSYGTNANNVRVYFSRWRFDINIINTPNEYNEIWSISLDANGEFIPASLKREIKLPLLLKYSGTITDSSTYSNPVSDIEFSGNGDMLCAERSMFGNTGVCGVDGTRAHRSRILEYPRDINGNYNNYIWHKVGMTNYDPPNYYFPHKNNSSGGVDFEYGISDSVSNSNFDCDSIIVGTGDFLFTHEPYPPPTPGSAVYGLQETQRSSAGNIDVQNFSHFIDINGDLTLNDKTTPGDVDVYRKDLCGSSYIDTNCIGIISDTTYCDSTGTYIYEFIVHNNSPTKTVEQLEITVDSPKPPNYVVTMPSTLNVTIPPSGTSEIQRVKLVGPGAIARAEVCYTLSAQYLHDDCPWCCYIESCIKLPDCGSCVEVLSDSLYCSGNNYFYNFLLENGTIYNVTKIQLTSPGADPVTFVPQIIHFATPIAPGEAFPSETVQILGGYAGLTVPIRIKLFSDDFECCYIELSHTFPGCDTLKTGINGNDLNIDEYKLGQNYPNPFNPTTNISFSIPEESNVELSIFDISGRLVQNIINNVKYVQGVYSVKFDGSNLPSGMYYYRLKTKDYIETRKMVLMK